MCTRFKTVIHMLVCVLLFAQMEGCIFVDHEHRGHGWHEDHHEEHDHADLDVRVH
jgi:hypothetical protein